MKMRQLRKAVMGLIAVILVLFLLNLLAMGREYLQHGTVRILGSPLGLYTEGGTKGGAALQPGARLEGASHNVSVNSLGFRGPEIAAQKPPGSLRVWCAGGSTTSDILVSADAAAWPAQLQGMLAKAAPQRVVEVINAGTPGAILSTNIRDFRRLAPQVKPDVLVIYQGPNDVRNIANARFGVPPMPHGLLTELSLYRLLTEVMPRGPLPREWDRNRLRKEDMGLLRQRVLELVGLARQLGARVVLTTHGHISMDTTTGKQALREMGKMAHTYKMSSEGLIAAYREMNGLFRDLALELDLPLADVRKAVGTDPGHWGDDIHFSDAGAAVAARAIADTLIKAGLHRPLAPPSSGASQPASSDAAGTPR